jgi:hypothetical protein
MLKGGLRRSCNFLDGRISDVPALEISQLGRVEVLNQKSVYFVEVIYCITLRTVKCLGYL